jgi:hypothetical protein
MELENDFCRVSKIKGFRTIIYNFEEDAIESRKCSVCGETKRMDEFTKNSYQPSGRRYECKVCDNKLRLERIKREGL